MSVKRKYYLLSIDSMRDGMGWYWNSACQEYSIHISDDVFDSNRKLLKMMREMGILSEDSKGKVVLDRYDGSSVEFQCRNYMPIYALQLAGSIIDESYNDIRRSKDVIMVNL